MQFLLVALTLILTPATYAAGAPFTRLPFELAQNWTRLGH